MPVKIIDRRLWERELTHHMRRHAADLHDSPPAAPEPGMWVSARKACLWTILVMIITSAGWAVGLYFI
ncbi:MAG: hypothetical protein ACRDRW_15010 [Pseudonocardiaceae bacterium]